MRRATRIAAALLGSAMVVSTVVAEAPPRGVCLGDLCVHGQSAGEEEIVARIASGQVEDSGLTHCYRVAESKLFFAFGMRVDRGSKKEVEWAYVGREPLSITCSSHKPAKGSVPYLKTREGLQVGDSSARVQELYESEPMFNKMNLEDIDVYAFCPGDRDCTVVETAIHVQGGKVIAIQISDAM